MSEIIRESAAVIDLSPRFALSTVVVASPAAAAETIIASVTVANFAAIGKGAGILVYGWAAYTIGTTGTACQVRLRQTNVAGTVVGNSGAQTGGHNTAAQLVADAILGFDSGVGVATYVMTLQVTGGSAPSTVSAVLLQATVL